MRRGSSLLTVALTGAAALGAATPARAQAPEPCAATFHVLHDDAIGALDVPAGQYRLATSDLSCARASHLFSEFLGDFDGVLPRPWRLSVEGDGRGTFRGRGRFTATRAAAGAPAAAPGPASEGGGSHGELRCRGTFDVRHSDRIGRLRIPAGDYAITLLGGNLTCTAAERFLGRFLRRPRGRLKGGWVVLPRSAEFVRSSSHHGFRIKAAVE